MRPHKSGRGIWELTAKYAALCVLRGLVDQLAGCAAP
jgi:hypothetical protein